LNEEIGREAKERRMEAQNRRRKVEEEDWHEKTHMAAETSQQWQPN